LSPKKRGTKERKRHELKTGDKRNAKLKEGKFAVSGKSSLEKRSERSTNKLSKRGSRRRSANATLKPETKRKMKKAEETKTAALRRSGKAESPIAIDVWLEGGGGGENPCGNGYEEGWS